jgi:hypothetical protein
MNNVVQYYDLYSKKKCISSLNGLKSHKCDNFSISIQTSTISNILHIIYSMFLTINPYQGLNIRNVIICSNMKRT